MLVNYDKVQSAAKDLGSIADNIPFLEGFLSAFNFPKSTFARLNVTAQKDVNQGMHIQGNGNVFFLSTTAANLYSEFNILKRNSLNRIKAAFIIIANETDLIAYDMASGDMLETGKNELYKHIEFFFSLLGIRPDTANDDMLSADIKAAEKFAGLYNELLIHNPVNKENVDRFVCNLLLCCFADSVGGLTANGLRPMIANYTDASGNDLANFFGNLFAAAKSNNRDGLPGYFTEVKSIDNRLFTDGICNINFNKNSRNIILGLLDINWSEITPEVLGALIQSTINPDSQTVGVNYTSAANIQKVIGPLFLDGLYHAFEQAKADKDALVNLLGRICNISIFDPSCGTGNFLLIPYKELSKLAVKISNVIGTEPPIVPVGNFKGIDSDWLSCEIARLGFLFTVCQETSIALSECTDILFADNIITANPVEIPWESVCVGNGETYIIGNPSYHGARKQTAEQKAELKRVFAGYDKVKNLDHASCWFMLATKYVSAHGGGFAFVTTNSLTQGEQVSLLWPKLFEYGVHIKFAHTSFKWKNDARNRTAVTVVVIGVVPNSDIGQCELYTPLAVFEPRSISPYLVPGNTIIQKERSPISDFPNMVKGNMPLYWSEHLMNHEEMHVALAADARIGKFLKRIVGSEEFINGDERWCFWIRDADLPEAMTIPFIVERIEAVRQSRLASPDKSAQNHAARPHKFREMHETHISSLVVPSVSSERREYIPIGFVDRNIVVTNLAFVIYDCKPWIFGVISSKMHNIWIRTVCGALETRIRYSSHLGYNTFPFPNITDEQKRTIMRCVRGVIAAREQYSDRTLAWMYAPESMPEELRYAHNLLDLVVEKCYREEPFVSDQERLDCLFELYADLKGE